MEASNVLHLFRGHLSNDMDIAMRGDGSRCKEREENTPLSSFLLPTISLVKPSKKPADRDAGKGSFLLLVTIRSKAEQERGMERTWYQQAKN